MSNKRWVSLGEILIEPDGSNMRPVASYQVLESKTAIDRNGRVLHRVTFERFKTAEEIFYSSGVRCVRSVQVPTEETVVTDNSATARWHLGGDQIVERHPVGDSYLDRLANRDEDVLLRVFPEPNASNSVNEAREVALNSALGSVSRSVIEDFRPITDADGNFTVSPFPVQVAKRD